MYTATALLPVQTNYDHSCAAWLEVGPKANNSMRSRSLSHKPALMRLACKSKVLWAFGAPMPAHPLHKWAACLGHDEITLSQTLNLVVLYFLGACNTFPQRVLSALEFPRSGGLLHNGFEKSITTLRLSCISHFRDLAVDVVDCAQTQV